MSSYLKAGRSQDKTLCCFARKLQETEVRGALERGALGLPRPCGSMPLAVAGQAEGAGQCHQTQKALPKMTAPLRKEKTATSLVPSLISTTNRLSLHKFFNFFSR